MPMERTWASPREPGRARERVPRHPYAGGGVIRRNQWTPDDSLRIDLVGIVEFPAGLKGETHSHPFWEILLVYSGSGNWRHERLSTDIGEGDVILIAPGMRHQFNASAASDLELFYTGFTFEPNVDPNIDDGGPAAGLAAAPALRKELRSMARDIHGLDGNLRADMRRRLFDTLGRLTTSIQVLSDDNRAPSRESMLVEKAKRVIEENLSHTLAVQDVASVFYLCPHYFADLFKRSTGMTVKEYHETVRLQRATVLLHDPLRTVTQVAQELGYSSVHYFSRRFKHYFGMSPSTFRR